MPVASRLCSAASVVTALVGFGFGPSIGCFVLVSSPLCVQWYLLWFFMKILLPFRYLLCLARGASCSKYYLEPLSLVLGGDHL